MNLPIEPPNKQILSNSTTSRSKSNSISSSSAIKIRPWIRQVDKHIWRAIDFLHIIIMFFSFYTAIIIAILRNELLEQCPLYAKLYLLDNATHFSTETIDRQTVWGDVYTCEFASFAYLSAFVLSFISLWIHIAFRRVVRTERLLRLPIGLCILIFALITLIATAIVTDGVIKFCLNSQTNICSSTGATIFSRSRWKILSLPVGMIEILLFFLESGWLTTLSILLNVFVRGIQLFSKPKKSPETLKLLLNQLMAHRHQLKNEKETSEHESQISRQSTDRSRSQSLHRYPPMNYTYNREFSPELYPYYYPSIPQYRQIEKRSRFQRICCPCFHRCCRRRSRPRPRPRHQSFHESYRPFTIPEEYFHRLNHLKQNGTVPTNLCYRHSMYYPVEQQTQTDLISERKSMDETSEIPFIGRRRSSVRFEDEIPLVKIPDESSTSSKIETSSIKNEENEETINPIISDNHLERNVSFRNNEDDLWTTITINTEQSVPIQSSHFNRVSLENLSIVDTSMSNCNNCITSIHINSKPSESISSESVEQDIISPSEPYLKAKQHCSPIINRYKSLPSSSSRSHTPSSEDDIDLHNIKPVEEIHAIVTDKYNYNNLSQALKSNVERLKNTFTHVQENQSHYDKPKNIRTTLSSKSFQNSNIKNHSSDC
ncbi:unnamed protein product [Rotaria sordida]|uniref:Uncharacterized protein n=1 Tax=Rotaria sordida TaxID=392033 RepID=A0A813W2N3_9BILA|nr:unnamed protein product [Rotaria sordida]CAF0952725.1 unnamed protein product [Rotaria sordida]CAF3498945.1 unnamed protein product [Rotaria sordida]CAF3770079.1 unnamed protein product [Rotaria sordida]